MLDKTVTVRFLKKKGLLVKFGVFRGEDLLFNIILLLSEQELHHFDFERDMPPKMAEEILIRAYDQKLISKGETVKRDVNFPNTTNKVWIAQRRKYIEIPDSIIDKVVGWFDE